MQCGIEQICILLVPKYYSASSKAAVGDYFKRMGYKNKAEDAGDDGVARREPEWESTDEYLGRMKGYVLFYAAILQSDAYPEGPGIAWAFLARYAPSLFFPPSSISSSFNSAPKRD